MRPLSLTLACTAIATSLIACGGDSSETNTAPTPPPDITNGASHATANTVWVSNDFCIGTKVRIAFASDGTCSQRTTLFCFNGGAPANCTWSQSGTTVHILTDPLNLLCVDRIDDISGGIAAGSMVGQTERGDGVRGFCTFALTNGTP